MNQRLLAIIAFGSATVCGVVFTACGGDDTNTGDSGGNDATTNDVANDSPQNNDTGGNDTGGNDSGADAAFDTGCAPGPNCQQCCTTQYPDAAAFVAVTEQTCACTTPGDCKANNVCGNTLCKNQQPSGPCQQCLGDKDAGDCRAAAVAACVQNTTCQPLAQCVGQCLSGSSDAGGGG